MHDRQRERDPHTKQSQGKKHELQQQLSDMLYLIHLRFKYLCVVLGKSPIWHFQDTDIFLKTKYLRKIFGSPRIFSLSYLCSQLILFTLVKYFKGWTIYTKNISKYKLPKHAITTVINFSNVGGTFPQDIFNSQLTALPYSGQRGKFYMWWFSKFPHISLSSWLTVNTKLPECVMV